MHVYVISVVIYTTVLSQMPKSKSSSIQPQRSGHLKKKVEEDEEDEISNLEREPSPIDDYDADGDYSNRKKKRPPTFPIKTHRMMTCNHSYPINQSLRNKGI